MAKVAEEAAAKKNDEVMSLLRETVELFGQANDVDREIKEMLAKAVVLKEKRDKIGARLKVLASLAQTLEAPPPPNKA